jgi:hypothetical protein
LIASNHIKLDAYTAQQPGEYAILQAIHCNLIAHKQGFFHHHGKSNINYLQPRVHVAFD